MFVLMAMVPPSFAAEVIDLRRGARTTLYGGRYVPPPGNNNPPNGDLHGWAITTGDIDGDGYQDVLSTAQVGDGPDDTRFSSGDAHLVFGGPRSSLDSLYDLTMDADITIYGAYDDLLGWSARCADLDGDGYDEMIIGAPCSDGPDSTRFEAGEIYVFYGGPRETLEAVYDLRFIDPGIRIVGVGQQNIGGKRINGIARDRDAISYGMEVGDINGDGYKDLLFSAVESTSPQGPAAAGIVFVLLGRDRCKMPSLIDCDFGTSAAHPDIVIYGADDIDKFGFEFACADFDGDGIDDLLATAYGGDGRDNLLNFAGDIYGFWGRSHWASQYEIAKDEFDFAIQGPQGYRAGYRMTAGDLDGDGFDDLIIGSIVNQPNPFGRVNAGEYRILFGRPRPEWPRWTDLLPATDVLIIGADDLDTKSSSGKYSWGFFMTTGNRNADGFDDLLIGAGGADGPPWSLRVTVGEAYLILGRPRWEWEPFHDLQSDYDLIIYGADGLDDGVGGFRQDALGWAGVMADFDGNGKDDIFVTSVFADGPKNFRPDAGEVYVIYDSDSTDATAVAPARRGPPRVTLLQNYPNPFNAVTTLRFTAPEGSIASMTIHDAHGRKVTTPLRREVLRCSDNEVTWDSRDGSGRRLPSGIYFIRLEAAGEVHSQKITLLR